MNQHPVEFDPEDESELEREIDSDIAAGRSRANPIRRSFDRMRVWISNHPRFRVAYLSLVALFGVATMLIGLMLVPLPGPGWLIVFLGLAILGTEFHWARRLTSWARRKLEAFWRWWRRRRSRDDD